MVRAPPKIPYTDLTALIKHAGICGGRAPVTSLYGRWSDIQHRVRNLIPSAENDLTMCFVYAHRDPRQSLLLSRSALEAIVARIARDRRIDLSGDKVGTHIAQLEAGKAIHGRIRARMDSIRMFGNLAAHHGAELDEYDSERSADDLLFILEWLMGCPADTAVDSEVLSPALVAGLALLGKRIERATEEQKAVLDTLKAHRRVAISGCAGSGKTVLALEKATRLDKAGLRVLLLCHNPYLSDVIADALVYTDVQVSTFGRLVRLLLSVDEEQVVWNHYDDVSADDLDQAFELAAGGAKFDAIIVDEAQDFSEDWWLVVEAALDASGFLYLFFDNDQALLPLRQTYPSVDLSHTLSCNVRNSSEIADAVCKVSRIPMVIRPELAGGTMRITSFEKGGEIDALTSAVSSIFHAGLIDRAAVVATEVVDPRDSGLAGRLIPVLPRWSWQQAVKAIIPRLVTLRTRTKAPSSPQPRFAFPTLSDAPYPLDSDIEAIGRWARSYLAHYKLKLPDVEGLVSFSIAGDQLEVAGSNSPLAIAFFFSDGRWAEQLPKCPDVRLTAVGNRIDGLSLPLHSAASVKGLEYDGIISYIPTVVLDLKAHAYVALSRARLHQELLILREVSHYLPSLAVAR